MKQFLFVLFSASLWGQPFTYLPEGCILKAGVVLCVTQDTCIYENITPSSSRWVYNSCTDTWEVKTPEYLPTNCTRGEATGLIVCDSVPTTDWTIRADPALVEPTVKPTYIVLYEVEVPCPECTNGGIAFCYGNGKCESPTKWEKRYEKFDSKTKAIGFINGGLASPLTDAGNWYGAISQKQEKIRFVALHEAREVKLTVETTIVEEPQPPKVTETKKYREEK